MTTIKNAVAAAIKAGTKRSDIIVAEWSITYDRPESEIREAWAIALAKVPPNVGEVEGK